MDNEYHIIKSKDGYDIYYRMYVMRNDGTYYYYTVHHVSDKVELFDKLGSIIE